MSRRLEKPRPRQGAHLLALRKNAAFTQAELATAIGESQQLVALWEKSDKPPPSHALPKLARTLGVSVEVLLAAGKRGATAAAAVADLPGPTGLLQEAFERVRALPRRQQRKVVEVVNALVEQLGKTG